MRKSVFAVALTLGLLAAAGSVNAVERISGPEMITSGAAKEQGLLMAAAAATKDPAQTATSKKVSTKAPKKKAAKKSKKKSSPASRMAPGVVK